MNSLKNAIQGNRWFTFFSIVSVVLMVVSFILPPTGSIDSSVLAGVGELFAFAALGTVIKALDKGADAKITKGDVSIEIETPDPEK